MCLIIETEKETPMTKEFVLNVIKRNKDGVGMMWIDDKPQVRVAKAKSCDVDQIMEQYEKIKQFNPVIHFRMKTHGDIDLRNAHPYYCGHQTWLMHNGVLHTGNKANEQMSDTWHFTQNIVKPLLDDVKDPESFIFSSHFLDLMEEYHGYNNRMVFMNRKGTVITRVESWHEIKVPETKMVGIRVSNSYAWTERDFEPPKAHWVSKYQSQKTTTNTGTGGSTTTAAPLSKNQLKKLRKKEARAARKGEKPSDWFRRSPDGLAHVYDDWYVDTQLRVWKSAIYGYTRRPDMSYEDVYTIMQDDGIGATGRRLTVVGSGGTHSVPLSADTSGAGNVSGHSDNEDEYAETEISIGPAIPPVRTLEPRSTPALLLPKDFNLSEEEIDRRVASWIALNVGT